LTFYLGDKISPDTYRLKSEFDHDAPVNTTAKKIAFSFGASRIVYDKVYSPHKTINTDPRLPGPGHYQYIN
jgi:hypothetical protein